MSQAFELNPEMQDQYKWLLANRTDLTAEQALEIVRTHPAGVPDRPPTAEELAVQKQLGWLERTRAEIDGRAAKLAASPNAGFGLKPQK